MNGAYQRVYVRDRPWVVKADQKVEDGRRRLLSLLDPFSGDTLDVISPPEKIEDLPGEAPVFDQRSITPYGSWQDAHLAIKLASSEYADQFAALSSGRISPEPYQFAPVHKILSLPRPSLLIADDVGLGKTVEAGICLMELIARGRGKRILLILPPGLIPQWQDEMLEKFGLRFHTLENASALDSAKTKLSEGIKPWTFLDRVMTSVEYLKKREILTQALDRPWDVIVVDEAHYLAESGTPRNPYTTARARLGKRLRDACSSLILLTATPHNGYSHSFRSLLEIVEPTDATFAGDKDVIQRRVSRCMIRRLKSQIYKTDKNGKQVPAFQPRDPVKRIEITGLSNDEREIFSKVSAYCARTARSAGTDDRELVSFAMQIIKKRMLSSRYALTETITRRLSALKSRTEIHEPPKQSEIKEMQMDISLTESAQELTALRVIQSSIPKETRLRNAEKRQLTEIAALLKKVEKKPDPKIQTLLTDLKNDVLTFAGEKAMIFTEYRDTLGAIREAMQADKDFQDSVVELTGGLSPRQRQQRIAEFEQRGKRFLLATDAASEGLNLQHHCRRLYHCELPWNPNRMEQRNGRIDRHGQAKIPIIRYLFYPDSPEDNILDRLVRRIVEMQDDRVATPDILGMVPVDKVHELLTDIESPDDGKEKEKTLFQIFDERREQFSREIAPLMSAGECSQKKSLDSQSLSADPLMTDDLAFEQFMLRQLGNGIKAAPIPHTYSLVTPYQLRGEGVNDRYACLTMRRSVATSHSSSDVEFITRMHPLFLAILHEARRRLGGNHSPSTPSRRIAVCRHPLAKKNPYAIFTFHSSQKGLPQVLIPVAVDSAGKLLDDTCASVLLETGLTPGEVKWAMVSNHFEMSFSEIQAKAATVALDWLREKMASIAKMREGIARDLTEDAERYRKDRLVEIDRDEKEAKQMKEKEQILLFEKTVTGFKAQRAAIETHYKKRMLEIEEYARPVEPSPPQPLGVLFVFPMES